MKFKVGDVVSCTIKDELDSKWVFGLSGKIIKIDHGQCQSCLVNFIITPDHPIYVRGCTNELLWWIQESSLNLQPPKSQEEIEKERIDRVCNKIKYLDNKYARRMEKKKCQTSLNMNPVRTVEAETTSHDTQTGLRGVSAVDLRRERDAFVLPLSEEYLQEIAENPPF